MLGRAAVAMWWDIAAEMQAEFEDWHSHEHMPERLGIPGFLRGTRWRSLSGASSYFVLYEVKDLKTMTGGAYLERLNDPTPWSRKLMPHHGNMVRTLCKVRARSGGGVGHALATVRLSPPRRGRGAIFRWLAEEAFPPLARGKGLTGAALLEGQPMPGRTTEQEIRGRDGEADSVLLVNGYDPQAVEAAAGELCVALESRRTGCERAATLYAPSYCLVAKDFAA